MLSETEMAVCLAPGEKLDYLQFLPKSAEEKTKQGAIRREK